MRNLLALLTLAVLPMTSGCGAGGGAGDQASPSVEASLSETVSVEKFDINGYIHVDAISLGKAGEECRPDEPSSERPARSGAEPSGVKVGGVVTVSNAADAVIAHGIVKTGTYSESVEEGSSRCTMPFVVEGVTEGGDYFGIQVGDQPVKMYPRSDLDGEILLDLS